MSGTDISRDDSVADRLTVEGYWVARAAGCLKRRKHADCIRICRDYQDENPDLVSGHLVYATALYRSGQTELAADQFRRVLSLDPENIVALKYLGDISYESKDIAAAMANYQRVLEIDPFCRGVKAEIRSSRSTITRTVTLTRGSELRTARSTQALREIPFYTETMGDLYLSQGHPRLAAEVFRYLTDRVGAPSISEKLVQAERKIKEKES